MRGEKNAAAGMLKVWHDEYLQLKQTCLMADITAILQTLQQNLQKGNLILPDVITLRNNAIRKLRLIVDNPYPGGYEEKMVKSNNSKNIEEQEDDDMGDEPKPSPR